MPRFEFEDPRFTLTDFIVVNNIFADNTVINLPDGVDTGSATTTFDLPSGTYQVVLNAADEPDGNSTVEVVIGDQTFSFTLDNPNPGANDIFPNAESFKDITVAESIFIPEGTQITINGVKDNQEFVRLDYIDFNLINESPVAVDDTVSTGGNPNVTIDVLANDSDTEGDAVLTIDQQGGNGTAVVNQDGTITYTANDGFTGLDTFTYQLDDGTNPPVTATVEVNVDVPNEAPVAVDDTATTALNTAVNIDVLANDSDTEGDALTVTLDQQGANGTAEVNQDGTITYTPVDGFLGTDTFTYQIDDGTNAPVTATVNVDVTAPNESPVAVDDTATTVENTAVDINVLANDSDPDGDALTVAIDQQGANGTAVVNQDGTITYTPVDGFTGTDTFTYQIDDGTNPAVTATVDVDVTAPGPGIIATDDTATTAPNTAVNINVLANDIDPEGDPLTVTLDQQGANGTAVVNQDGTITYTPNADFTGPDSFTYQITDGTNPPVTATVDVDVTTVNESPVAADDTATTEQNTAVDINVLANDVDPEGDPLTVTLDQQGANGTAVVNQDGTITYTPVDGFTGADTFTYQISDGTNPAVTATVNVDVTAPNESPIAVDDTATTVGNTAVDINVLANDSDPEGDALNVAINRQGGNGTAVVNQDGTITYTPVDGFTGADNFIYQIDDGTNPAVTGIVNVDVTVPNQAPVALDDTATTVGNTAVDINVLTNDSDLEGDALAVTINEQGLNGTVTVNEDSTITYTPNNGFIGFDRFTYQIDDGTNPAVTATVNVDVTAPNQAPVAVDDTATTEQNTAVNINVLGNDSDPENDALTFTIATNPNNGTAVVNDNGTLGDGTDDFIIYTPNADFTGTDSLTYQVSDGNGGTSTATANITIEQTTPITPTTPLTVNANNIFTVNGNSAGEAPLQFTLTSRELGEVSEIGAFVADDALGTVDGIAPGQSGYAEAALFRAETIFSVLPDSLGSAQPTRIIDSFNPNDNLVFYVIQGGSVDGVLAGQDSTSNVFFGGASFNSDGQNHLQVTDNGNGQLTVRFEDGNDFDFNDATVVVSDGTGSTAPLGGGPNDIQGILELIDLTDVTGTVTGSLVVNSEAEFNNTVGWYVVDNFSGTVNGLNPGDAGYAEAALSNQVNLSVGVSGGVILAPFLISDGTVAEFLANNPSNAAPDDADSGLNAYFAYVGANPDQVDHIRLLGDNTFGFEDLFGGGDEDFNDVVAQVNLTVA